MKVENVVEELEACDPEGEVYVEINGVTYPITVISDDSQGVYFTIDPDDEDRKMR